MNNTTRAPNCDPETIALVILSRFYDLTELVASTSRAVYAIHTAAGARLNFYFDHFHLRVVFTVQHDFALLCLASSAARTAGSAWAYKC